MPAAAALEPQHALAGARQAHQLGVDFVLRHGVLIAALADENTLGVTAHQVEDGRRKQAVVQNHVRLLHQPQGAERQQIRIAGTGADQIDLAWRRLTRQQALQFCRGGGIVAAQGGLRTGSIEKPLPDRAALRQFAGLGDARPLAMQKRRQPAVACRQPGLELLAQTPRQNRRRTAAGDRDLQRRAVDYRRSDE